MNAQSAFGGEVNTHMTHAADGKKAVRIGKNVHFEVDELVIGDGVKICDNVSIEGSKVHIGDYTLIRENTQLGGNSALSIGMCCWIGQGVIIDSTEKAYIGNGVGIGAHSQLWTHMKFGDILQGCNWDSQTEMRVDDDVWFVGHCLVSPIHAGAQSMAMLGSVVTRDMKPNHIYAGVPATDMTERLGNQYRSVTVDEKFTALQRELDAFAAKGNDPSNIKIVKEWPSKMERDVTYFNVATREYTKRLSDTEIAFMLHLLVKIKFYPALGK
jgi:acetyltransferase-like isoleucine patch superfamily enzyme